MDPRAGQARKTPARGGRNDVEFKPIETQEQFDEMVKERIERAKRSAIPADYEELKAKAAKYDESEAKNKTELQKAQEAAAAAQKELADVRARQERDDLARKVAEDKGVPVDLITGATQEEMERSADALIAWKTPDPAPRLKNPGAHDNKKKDRATAETEFVKALFNN